MGYVMFGQFGQVHKAPSTTEPVFADNTWEQIIKACQTNTVPDTWEVGDQKAMTIGETEHMITIIGKYHDTYSSGGGKAPLTLQMQNCLDTEYSMHSTRSNTMGWRLCDARAGDVWEDVCSMFPQDLVSEIKRVDKVTSVGNKSSELETTGDDIFLLSEIEVFGTSTNSFAGEGEQYAYYAAGNSKVKRVGATNTAWWLRSPDNATATRFCRVSTSGAIGDYYADGTYGMSYAFCF